jgi:hypothetical protein
MDAKTKNENLIECSPFCDALILPAPGKKYCVDCRACQTVVAKITTRLGV